MARFHQNLFGCCLKQEFLYDHNICRKKVNYVDNQRFVMKGRFGFFITGYVLIYADMIELEGKLLQFKAYKGICSNLS